MRKRVKKHKQAPWSCMKRKRKIDSAAAVCC